MCDDALRSLLRTGAIEVADQVDNQERDESRIEHDCVVYDTSELIVSKLGRAAIKGCMELSVAKQLLKDLEVASRSLVLMGSLHLLYLVTPHAAAGIRPDYRHYYSLVSSRASESTLVLMGSLHLLYLVTPHAAAGIRPDYRHYYSLVSFCASEGTLVLMGSLHLLYLVTPHAAAGIRPDYRHYYSLVSFCASEGTLVLMGSLHLLYLVTPHAAAGIRPDYRHYYSLVSSRASEGTLVLMGSLHLLYLVTPHAAAGIRPDYRHYYSLYCNLDEEGIQTAKILGITEMNAIRMMTGKPITNVPEIVLCRFYLALMLHDLWKQVPFPDVSYKYCLPRGTVQSVMTSSAAFASSAVRLCEQLSPLWAFRALLAELAPRLQHCAAPELHQLMELPAVKKARAVQLMRAGYKRIEDLAKASVDDLVSNVTHLSRSAATHLVSAARMMLIEKVENLRAEAEIVMEGLNF
ncbi:hypothetical protein O0L34_g18436 [Tuta absoluta]|nr:hypothetical protein O0L34_g18436 [Tuta absoluta]